MRMARKIYPYSLRCKDAKIAGVASTYDKAKRELTVTLQSDILFAPGSADIRQDAKPSLDKVAAAVKKDYAGKKILIVCRPEAAEISRTDHRGVWSVIAAAEGCGPDRRHKPIVRPTVSS